MTANAVRPVNPQTGITSDEEEFPRRDMESALAGVMELIRLWHLPEPTAPGERGSLMYFALPAVRGGKVLIHLYFHTDNCQWGVADYTPADDGHPWKLYRIRGANRLPIGGYAIHDQVIEAAVQARETELGSLEAENDK